MECVARAVNSDGQPGLEVASNAVTVSSEEGVCLPQVTGAQGAEPFSAKLKYTGKCRVTGVGYHTGNVCTCLRSVAAAKVLGVCVSVCVGVCRCVSVCVVSVLCLVWGGWVVCVWGCVCLCGCVCVCVCVHAHTWMHTHITKNNICSTYTPHVCFKS